MLRPEIAANAHSKGASFLAQTLTRMREEVPTRSAILAGDESFYPSEEVKMEVYHLETDLLSLGNDLLAARN